MGNLYAYSNTPQANNSSAGSLAGYKSKVGVIETIHDIPNNPGGYNPVDHTKEVWDFPLRSFAMVGEGTRYGGKLGHCVTVGSLASGHASAQGYTNPGSLWDTDANALIRATNAIQYNIQDAPVDLPTLMGELAEYRDLVHDVLKGFLHSNVKSGKNIDSVRSKFDRFRQSFKTTRHVLESIAAADLFNQFAVKPLVRDITKMLELGKHLQFQLSRLQRLDAVAVKGSVSDDADEIVVSTLGEHKYTRYTSKTRTITAWREVKYDLSEIPSMPLVMADALGFDNIHRSIWELIPWSFLVDYFIQVGDWLKQFRGEFISIPYTVLSEGYSVKFESECEVVSEIYSQGTLAEFWNVEAGEDRIISGQVNYTRYRRFADPLPVGAISYPTIKAPNLRQVRNLLDLTLLKTSDRGKRTTTGITGFP